MISAVRIIFCSANPGAKKWLFKLIFGENPKSSRSSCFRHRRRRVISVEILNAPQ
jgi:hypothetical protein